MSTEGEEQTEQKFRECHLTPQVGRAQGLIASWPGQALRRKNVQFKCYVQFYIQCLDSLPHTLNKMNRRKGVHALTFTSQRDRVRSKVTACSPFPRTASRAGRQRLDKCSLHKGWRGLRRVGRFDSFLWTCKQSTSLISKMAKGGGE